MSFRARYGFPFYQGTVALAEVGTPASVVSIGSRWWPVDRKIGRLQLQSIQAMRPQQDTDARPGEQTLSAEASWNRAQVSWIKGAGQSYYDRATSDPARFRRSRGVDPWTEWELSLLHDVTSVSDATGTWNDLVVGSVAGVSFLAAAGDSGALRVVSAAETVTSITGLAGSVSVASDGARVYVGHGGGVSIIADTLTAVTDFNTHVTAPDALGYYKGRLLVGKGPALWNPVDSTTATAYFTAYQANFVWTGFSDGLSTLFGCGNAGQRGYIYALPIKDDATGMDPGARVAATLPDGELVYAIAFYVGYLVIGTSKGLRLAQIDASGGLSFGPVVETGPCRTLEPQDRFVWFGWDSMHSPSESGLGRADLSVFATPLAPAYATDLTGYVGGAVEASATFNNKRWFTVAGKLYKQATGYLHSGWVDTGFISMGIDDAKVMTSALLRHSVLRAGESVTLSTYSTKDAVEALRGVSVTVGTEAPLAPIDLEHNRVVATGLVVTLRGPGTTTPRLYRVSISGQPSPSRSSNWLVPLVLADVLNVDGAQYLRDCYDDLVYLIGLAEEARLTRFSMGRLSRLVFVEDYEWTPSHTPGDGVWAGTMVLKMKSAELGV